MKTKLKIVIKYAYSITNLCVNRFISDKKNNRALDLITVRVSYSSAKKLKGCEFHITNINVATLQLRVVVNVLFHKINHNNYLNIATTLRF